MYIYEVFLDMGDPIDIPTGMEAENQKLIPAGYNLQQNYPNPFNPLTQIRYSIAQKGIISLKVYNLLGKEVATLFAGIRQPGNYEVTFNGKELASGIYFYQLKANDFVKINKMILLK